MLYDVITKLLNFIILLRKRKQKIPFLFPFLDNNNNDDDVLESKKYFHRDLPITMLIE